MVMVVFTISALLDALDLNTTRFVIYPEL